MSSRKNAIAIMLTVLVLAVAGPATVQAHDFVIIFTNNSHDQQRSDNGKLIRTSLYKYKNGVRGSLTDSSIIEPEKFKSFKLGTPGCYSAKYREFEIKEVTRGRMDGDVIVVGRVRMEATNSCTVWKLEFQDLLDAEDDSFVVKTNTSNLLVPLEFHVKVGCNTAGGCEYRSIGTSTRPFGKNPFGN